MAKKIKTGRKKVQPSEKVILVGFYIKRKMVDRVGGMEQARNLAFNHITELATIQDEATR